MPSIKVHEKWDRPEGFTFDVVEGDRGWSVEFRTNTGQWSLNIPLLPTEEAATKVGQAILDYSYGPADKIKWGKPKPKDDMPESKTRKAPPKKAKKTETAASAAGGN